MMTSDLVEQRLIQAERSSASARSVLDLLAAHAAKPVSSGPAAVTVSEALRLWRTRRKNTQITKAKIEGLDDLLDRLEGLAPQRRLDQFGFMGPKTAITVFFVHTDGSYVGSAILDRRD